MAKEPPHREDIGDGVQIYETSRVVTTESSPSVTRSLHESPMNWPLWNKIIVLVQVSLLAALGGLNTATINPALVDLGEEFEVSTVHASYQTTVCIALNGVAPWLWIPLANKYGRRPVYIFTTLLGFVSALACGYTRTFTELVVARVFNGFFPVAFALGASTITDLFPDHQRGRAMGFFTVTMSTGSHIAPIVGGLIGGYLGWRWIFRIVSIIDAVMLLTCVCCLPETLCVNPNTLKDNSDGQINSHTISGSQYPSVNIGFKQVYRSRLTFISPLHKETAPLQPLRFLRDTFSIMWYPSILFPALYYATNYGFASILPAVTVAAIFHEAYHWPTLTIGLTYGTALTIGGILGELFAGWIVDALYIRAKRMRARTGTSGRTPSEVRLACIWPGEILLPSALLIYGFTLHYHESVNWFAPIFAIGLGCFGLQIITTTCYTYAIDCYREKSGEVAQAFNFARQMIGMTFAFYTVKLGNLTGFQWLFVIYAVFGGVLAFIGILLLMWRGESWRANIASKTRDKDTVFLAERI